MYKWLNLFFIIFFQGENPLCQWITDGHKTSGTIFTLQSLWGKRVISRPKKISFLFRPKSCVKVNWWMKVHYGIKLGGWQVGQQLADQSKFFPTNYFHIAIHFYTWFSLKVPLDSLYLVIHFCKLSDKSCSQINPKNSKSRYLFTMLPSEPECFWTKKRIHNKLKLCLNLKVSVLLLSNSKMPRYYYFQWCTL